MCDTIVALPPATSSGCTLFGKNSDRQRNEAQGLEIRPAGEHASGEVVRCTYIEVPQAHLTHAVLLSRPFWIWGAEMGANEHGVAIGNEGLHSREAAPKDPALTGMDLVRLGLERGASAAEALQVITEHLERYGQGGNCGHLTPAYYNNSFLIADPLEAFVLETIGQEWVAERVVSARAISNHYSIGESVHAKSDNLDHLLEASDAGDGPVNYARLLANPQSEHIGQSRLRRERATALMLAKAGSLQPADMMDVLRDHRATGTEEWDPRTSTNIGLCIHGGEHDAQTTASMVSMLKKQRSIHWVTGTSAPCISVFKPIVIGLQLPEIGPRPTGSFDASTLWWRHERLYRTALLSDLPAFLESIHSERQALEAEFRNRCDAARDDPDILREVIAGCWRDAAAMEAGWGRRLAGVTPRQNDPLTDSWSEMNRLAGLELIAWSGESDDR